MTGVPILVVEDDPDARATFCDVLQLDGHTVESAGSLAEVRSLGRREDLAVVLLDRKLPDGTAEDLYPELRRMAPHAAIIVVTGHQDLDGAVAALREGAEDYLPKPVNGELLRSRVARAAAHRGAQRALQETRERLAQILDAAGEGIYGLDAEGRTTFINSAGAKLLGWEPEELVGKLQHDVIHHTRRDGSQYPRESCPIHTAFGRGERHQATDEVLWRKNGTSFPVECLGSSIRRGGELVGAVVTFRDVTERRDLEAQIALAEDQQRRALASDLHDDVGQLHSLLSIKCRALRDLARGTDLVEPIREIEALAREARERITSLSFELSPPLLHDVGPLAAAGWLADHMKECYGLGVELVSGDELNDFDEPARVVFFRALRELLINVAKHAGTGQARVEIERRGDALVLSVADDGAGFDPDASSSRFGLANLRARLEQLGGSLVIESALGRGTTASAVVPQWRAGTR